MLRYTVDYSRVILLVWPTMLTCVQSLGSLCIYLWHMHIVHTTQTDTYREKKKKPTQHTHTHTETESQRFLSLFHLNIFIHSLFLTFSLSVCIAFVVAVAVVCCLFYFSFHSLFFPPAHSIGITVHRVAAIRFDILQYKALARVMELANSLNPTNTLILYIYTQQWKHTHANTYLDTVPVKSTLY